MQKLAELEATAPKVTKKKMLNEDSTTPPMNVSNKPASLKDVFENMAMQKPIPVVGKQGDTTQTGAGFLNVTDNSPAAQALSNALGDLAGQKKVQIVVPTHPGQQTGQPAPAGATGQPQVGQMQMKEKDEGKPGKNFAKIAKSAGERYGSKAAGERVAGAVRAKLAKQGKLEEENLDEISKGKAMQALQYAASDPDDERSLSMQQKIGKKWPEMKKHAADAAYTSAFGRMDRDIFQDPDKLAARAKTSYRMNKGGTANKQDLKARFRREVDEGAKVDRMVKHIEKSERKLGKSKEKASDIAWATANKRGMLDNKNKKKVKEGDIAPTNSIDTRGAGLGAGRSQTTLEGNKMARQVNEIFGLSAKEKAAKADEALKVKFAQAMEINNVFEKAKAVDDLALSAIEAGKGSDFFRSLGFKSQVEYPKGWYQTMPYWSSVGSDSPKPSYRTVYGMEALTGSPLTSNRVIDILKAKKYAEDDPRGFKPGHSPSKIWALPGGNNQTLLVWLHNANVAEGKKPDFLDLDKDGNKKETMKKAAADKKKQKVKESMNHRISAARLEGKSHGLRGHAHSGKRYEDLEEMKAYHEGYKEGLDECYGQGVYETAPAMPAATVPGMASQALDEIGDTPGGKKALASYIGKRAKDMSFDNGEFISDLSLGDGNVWDKYDKGMTGIQRAAKRLSNEDEMEEGNLFTGNLAKARASGAKSFDLDGDGDMEKVKETAYAFESLDQQLNALLNESEEVTEGLSVSVSKGNDNSEDSVNINATGPESEHLMAIVKSAGLGLFGDDHDHEPSSAMSIQPAHGAPDEVGAGGVDIGVVDGHDGMMGLMQKLSGIQADGDEDYADEEGHSDCGCEGDCDCNAEVANEQACNECGGMMEAGHSCGSKEMVDEVETEDQMEFEVAEDNAPDSGAAETTADEDAEAEEDKALALKSMNESFFDILARLEKLAEGSGDEPKHNEHDDKDDKDQDDAEEEEDVTESEDLNEWANQVGDGPGKGTDASFEQDIEFMTKVIAGGLNKPKSTGQTTVPVIAGQDDRMHDNPSDWAALAGIRKA